MESTRSTATMAESLGLKKLYSHSCKLAICKTGVSLEGMSPFNSL